MFYLIGHSSGESGADATGSNPQLINTGLDMGNNNIPKRYSLPSAYRLVLSGIKTDEYDDYFSNCFVIPDTSYYTQMNKAEADEVLSRASLHSHDFFEIMFVLSGEVYVNIENERHVYRKGSSYILNSNVMHTEEYNTDFEIVFLQISTDLMKYIYSELTLNLFDIEKINSRSDMNEFLSINLGPDTEMNKAYVDFIPNGSDEEIAKTLHNYFDEITRETMMPQIGSTISVLNSLKKLFIFLSISGNFSTVPVQIGTTAENTIFEQIMMSMAETDGRISRSQLSKKLNYSGVYLNEICKKYTGKTLFDYGMTFCMKKAASILTDSNDNINDISATLGFANKTHFYKVFKEQYGMTPAEYRREHKRRS